MPISSRWEWLWLVLILFAGISIQAQTVTVPVQVFRTVSDSGNTAGQDTLTFISPIAGTVGEVDVYGERYTPMQGELLFFDRLNNRMMLAAPDGSLRPHPFIQPGANTRRVDWVISEDERLIAWTLTDGTPQALTTTTTVANLDGTNSQQLLIDGPREGIRAMPVAFSADDTALYMDYQPDGLEAFTPYRQHAGLFELRWKDGDPAPVFLPDEPGCFCGAGFGASHFLRLTLADDLSGFDLVVHDLIAQTQTRLDAVALNGYTQGGDVLVSPDGSRAIYALTRVQDFGTPSQTLRTVFVLVDLLDMTQRPITSPLEVYIRPVAWTENNSAVIFSHPTQGRTWKLDIESERLEPIADAIYVGVIMP